jgi:SOS-response transcriptional repressor LexA
MPISLTWLPTTRAKNRNEVDVESARFIAAKRAQRQLLMSAMQPSTCSDAAPFSLRVTDDSMEPEFRRLCIVIIDPTGHARDGAYVLAEVEGGYIFRRLRIDANRVWLEALKEGYPPLELDAGIAAIKGVVVQRAGTRRGYHKRYD